MGNSQKRKHVVFPDLESTTIQFENMGSILAYFPLNDLNIWQQRSLYITDSMRRLYAELKQIEFGWTRVLTGVSGAGKSTSLLFIGHMAVSSGCIVFSLQGHEMWESKVHEWNQFILLRWMEAVGKGLLSEIKCPLNKSMSLYDLVSIGAKDSRKSISTVRDLILNLSAITVVPVVILIDQFNVFHTCTAESDTEVASICKFISGLRQTSMRRGCILFAYSVSSSEMPIASGEYSLLNIQIYPMDFVSFELFVHTLTESFKTKLPVPIEDLFSLCMGLPREAVSIFSLIAHNREENFDVIRTKYFDSRALFYKHRIWKVTRHRTVSEAVRRKSVTFAVRLFIGERMTSAPSIWQESGLIVRKDMHVCVPCEAAERGLINSFCEDTTREALQIFNSDINIRWRALELAFVFVVRQSIIAGNPVTFNCTDLKGESPKTIHSSLDRILHYSSHLKPSSVAKGTLVVCPRRDAVVCFLLFGRDGVKLYVEVSDSAFEDRSSHMKGIPKVDGIYQNALIQTTTEMQVGMLYLYISTSRKQLECSSKFNPNVLLISNATDSHATSFFRNLLL